MNTESRHLICQDALPIFYPVVSAPVAAFLWAVLVPDPVLVFSAVEACDAIRALTCSVTVGRCDVVRDGRQFFYVAPWCFRTVE